jgi:hypothetical protein
VGGINTQKAHLGVGAKSPKDGLSFYESTKWNRSVGDTHEMSN